MVTWHISDKNLSTQPKSTRQKWTKQTLHKKTSGNTVGIEGSQFLRYFSCLMGGSSSIILKEGTGSPDYSSADVCVTFGLIFLALYLAQRVKVQNFSPGVKGLVHPPPLQLRTWAQLVNAAALCFQLQTAWRFPAPKWLLAGESWTWHARHARLSAHWVCDPVRITEWIKDKAPLLSPALVIKLPWECLAYPGKNEQKQDFRLLFNSLRAIQWTKLNSNCLVWKPGIIWVKRQNDSVYTMFLDFDGKKIDLFIGEWHLGWFCWLYIWPICVEVQNFSHAVKLPGTTP